MTNSNSKLENLTTTLSIVAGLPIEITIRGEKKFTFSFEGQNETALERIKAYFKGGFKYDNLSGYEPTCDMTCLFAELN